MKKLKTYIKPTLLVVNYGLVDDAADTWQMGGKVIVNGSQGTATNPTGNVKGEIDWEDEDDGAQTTITHSNTIWEDEW